MKPGQVTPEKLAAWEAAADLNATLNLIAREDEPALRRTCEIWLKARGRDAAEKLWRDVVAGIREKRRAA
jgi:hypothetical protein